jgi:hypothetical protein
MIRVMADETRRLRTVRRTRVVVALLGSLLLTVPAHGAPRSDTNVMTIRVVSVTVAGKTIVDKEPKGVLNIGDVLQAKSNLRNERPQFGRPKGALVGSDVATLIIESETMGAARVTAKLPGGTIRSSGRVTHGGDAKAEIRVTGGTGVFAGARGTVSSRQLTRERDLNIYRLQLP